MSKFLEKQRKQYENPLNGVRKIVEKRCVVLAVYDSDFSGEVPEEIKELQDQYPGCIFAQVQLTGAYTNSGMFYVPFGYSVDELVANYGNSLSIIGRPGILRVRNNNYKSGLLYLIRDNSKRIINHSETKEIYDIGRI